MRYTEVHKAINYLKKVEELLSGNQNDNYLEDCSLYIDLLGQGKADVYVIYEPKDKESEIRKLINEIKDA